jgi:hypothetical protein
MLEGLGHSSVVEHLSSMDRSWIGSQYQQKRREEGGREGGREGKRRKY